jgi:ketosteroid isomerase-like protein
MSRNVEVVRQVWKAYADRGIEGVLEYFAEDCVCEDFPDLPDRRTYRGRDEVREWYGGFARIWGELTITPTELIEVDSDVVVSVGSIRGRGKGSSAPVDVSAAWVSDLADGKIVRARAFRSKREALEAAAGGEGTR